MNKKFIKLIKKYNTIIITRHSNPDMDAIGSQVGLGEILKLNFPNKKIYLTGDTNRMDYENKMDNPSPDIYKGALLIITDVAVKSMIADKNYKEAKEIIVIDHHENDCDIENVSLIIKDTTAEAAALQVAILLFDLKMKFNKVGSQYLLNGIITDSGRYEYVKSNPWRLFYYSSLLAKNGADPKELYSWLYLEKLIDRQAKINFNNKINFSEGVAFIKTTKDDFKQMENPDFFKISRGMVGLMSGIDEIKIWANFTYNTQNDKVVCEFRTREYPILDIAKKYGGGGHLFACGATIDNFDVADTIIEEFKELIKKGI